MLVLSRKRDEAIVLAAGTPYETRITVVEIRGDKVRLGFDAASNVEINRDEIQNRISHEIKTDSRIVPDDPHAEELRELDRLTSQVKNNPALVAEYDLRNIAISRMDVVDVDTKLHRRLARFVEMIDNLPNQK